MEPVSIEPQSEVIKREILSRYIDLSAAIATLAENTSCKTANDYQVGWLTRGIRTGIIDLINLASTDTKFYNSIEADYKKFTGFKLNTKTRKTTQYGAETILEIWEIIRKQLIEHSVIQLKEGK